MVRKSQLTRAVGFRFNGQDPNGYCRGCERHISRGPHDLDLTVAKKSLFNACGQRGYRRFQIQRSSETVHSFLFGAYPVQNRNIGHGWIKDGRLRLRWGSERSERPNSSGSFAEELTDEIAWCFRTVRTAQHIPSVR